MPGPAAKEDPFWRLSLPDPAQRSFERTGRAHHVVDVVPEGRERTVALRKLLESNDAAVRAVAVPEYDEPIERARVREDCRQKIIESKDAAVRAVAIPE